jgi:hypothetical protein
MEKIDSIRPTELKSPESRPTKGQPHKEEAPKAESAAIINDTRPALEPSAASSLAGSLSTRVDESPDAAFGALGNFDEARIRALLED